MTAVELKMFLIALIGFDILIVATVVFLIRKFKAPSPSFDKALNMIENLIKDADETERRFGLQMAEKRRLITTLNQQLDQRIISLNMLLNRADLLTAASSNTGRGSAASNTSATIDQQQAQIIDLAREGRDVVEIAEVLGISKGEVQLVLTLKQQLARTGTKGES